MLHALTAAELPRLLPRRTSDIYKVGTFVMKQFATFMGLFGIKNEVHKWIFSSQSDAII